MMTLGVIGASGTLGRVAVKSLLEADSDLQVRALVRRDDSELSALSRCTLDSGGIFDGEALDNLCRDSDVVVNLAARNPEGQKTDLTNLDSFLRTNALGAAAVAAAAARHSTPLIHFSTVAVYETGEYRRGDYIDESEALPAGDGDVNSYFGAATDLLVSALEADSDETRSPVNDWRAYCDSHAYPRQASVYGLTKLIGEQAVLRLTDNVCCIRMSDVYGPGHESRGVIADHLASLANDASVTVDLDFRATAAFIYIQDVISFIAELKDRFVAGVEVPRIVNLVGPCLDEAALRDELFTLAKTVGLDRLIVTVEPTTEKFDRRYSKGVFGDVFTDSLTTPIDVGLRQTWDVLLQDRHSSTAR